MLQDIQRSRRDLFMAFCRTFISEYHDFCGNTYRFYAFLKRFAKMRLPRQFNTIGSLDTLITMYIYLREMCATKHYIF